MAEEQYISKELTVGTTPILISEEQAGERKRNVLTITNTDRNATGAVIYIDFDNEPIVGAGIPLYPTGTWSETIDNRYNVTKKRVFAVSTLANCTIAIHERVE